jgi:hypothetical protein
MVEYKGGKPPRELVKEPGRQLRWRLEDMEIGDELFVPSTVMTFRRVYLYVMNREQELGFHFTVDRQPFGALIRRTATHERSGRTGMVRPVSKVDSPVDWGLIEKEDHRKQWQWPFMAMEMGDVFWVLPEDLSIEKVRARAANVDGRHFNVTLEEQVNRIRVQRVPEAGVGWESVKYGVVRDRVGEFYVAPDEETAWDAPFDKRLRLDFIYPPDMAEGDSVFFKAARTGEPSRTSYVFDSINVEFGFSTRHVLEMEEEGIRVTCVPLDMTQQRWDKLRVEQNPFA